MNWLTVGQPDAGPVGEQRRLQIAALWDLQLFAPPDAVESALLEGEGGAGDARPSIRRTGVRSSKNLGQKNRCSDGSRRSARRASSWRSSLRLSSTRPKAGGKVDLTVGTAFESVSEVRASTASCNCRGCGSPDPVHGVIDSTPRVRSPSGLRRRAHRSQRSSATPRRRRRARP